MIFLAHLNMRSAHRTNENNNNNNTAAAAFQSNFSIGIVKRKRNYGLEKLQCPLIYVDDDDLALMYGTFDPTHKPHISNVYEVCFFIHG